MNQTSLRRFAALGVVVLLGGFMVACEQVPRSRVITYRIATRGHITADLGQFAQHVA